MSKRPRNLIISGSTGKDEDQSYIRRRGKLAYKAIERALRARWLAIDWDTHSLLHELKVCLRISIDQCIDIRTTLKQELEVVSNRRLHNPAYVAQVPNAPGWGRANLPQRHLYSESELRGMDESAYEAVERAFRIQQVGRRHAVEAQNLRLLAQLRDTLGIPEEHYNHVLERLERQVKTRPRIRGDNAQVGGPGEPNPAHASREASDDDETLSGNSEREPKYRSVIVLSYGSFEEWERRKVELLQPIHRMCNRDEEDTDGFSDADHNDDDDSLDKSDEEWKSDKGR